MNLNRYFAALVAVLSSTASAQTYTECNPLTNSSCPADAGLDCRTYFIDFTSGSDDDNWSSVGSGSIEYTSRGAEFTINEKGEAPTIASNWYIFFGRVEIHMKAASGTGIVSSAVLLSDVLDEVDWEWIGGAPNEVQTNYFGKGNTTTYDRATTLAVTDSQATSHNYTIDWTETSCTWYLDGKIVRTLASIDVLDGKNYPQTPMRVKLGIWAGGDSDNEQGTIDWAGGETNYDDAPFTMIVQSVKVTNYSPAEKYTYGDRTGDWTSIEIDDDDVCDGSQTTSTTAKATTAKTTTAMKTYSAYAALETASTVTVEANSDAVGVLYSVATSTLAVVDESSSVGKNIAPDAWAIVGALIVFFLTQL